MRSLVFSSLHGGRTEYCHRNAGQLFFIFDYGQDASLSCTVPSPRGLRHDADADCSFYVGDVLLFSRDSNDIMPGNEVFSPIRRFDAFHEGIYKIHPACK